MTTHALMELADLPPLPKCWTGSPVSVVWSEDCEVTSREVFTDDQMHAYGMQCAELALRTAAAEGGAETAKPWAHLVMTEWNSIAWWTTDSAERAQQEADELMRYDSKRKLTVVSVYLHPPTDSGAGRDGWLPIESAPKDGTEVVLLLPATPDAPIRARSGYWQEWHDEVAAEFHNTGEYLGQFPTGDGYGNFWWTWEGDYGHEPPQAEYAAFAPTHWQPLPAPPAIAGAAGEG